MDVLKSIGVEGKRNKNRSSLLTNTHREKQREINNANWFTEHAHELGNTVPALVPLLAKLQEELQQLLVLRINGDVPTTFRIHYEMRIRHIKLEVADICERYNLEAYFNDDPRGWSFVVHKKETDK